MKQITILSGKGGTGKTTITASFAALSRNAVFADCDVDASNLHLLLKPEVEQTVEFKGLKLAVIDSDRCTRCGLCEEKCRFNAIHDFKVDPIQCEGCGVCVYVCPVKAIDFVDRVCGHAYISRTRFGPMSHARLKPGMENSGKLVTLVRQNAKRLAEEKGRDLVLVDGPPGIGCPVIASLSEIDAGLVVVEPTLSGIHDLKRALGLLRHFKVDPLVCINKHDLNHKNTEDIEEFCAENGVEVVGLVPFDPEVTRAMVAGLPVVEYAPGAPASNAIKETWSRVKLHLGL
ncbi:(4Fe-4S)-binding protein [Candidatus Bathyarchaeota archaeon]|nr:MAG: (4Fe-4S)-binding protein [Candidatus Bathyarchaeota archaeon]